MRVAAVMREERATPDVSGVVLPVYCWRCNRWLGGYVPPVVYARWHCKDCKTSTVITT